MLTIAIYLSYTAIGAALGSATILFSEKVSEKITGIDSSEYLKTNLINK